jgi:hypothetical protein
MSEPDRQRRHVGLAFQIWRGGAAWQAEPSHDQLYPFGINPDTLGYQFMEDERLMCKHRAPRVPMEFITSTTSTEGDCATGSNESLKFFC